MTSPITFNQNTCLKCGLCEEVCPNKVIKKNEGIMSGVDERLHLCFKCGQCMCICPASAVCVNGLSYESDLFYLTEIKSYEESFFNMISSRRSVRNFRDIPVPRELLEKVVEAVSYAPIGFPPVKTEIIVVQDPDKMKKALSYMVDLYDFLYEAFKSPIKRFFIKKAVGVRKFKMMEGHLIPLLKVRLPGLKSGTEDTITRYAPAMILFHSDMHGEDVSADLHIAAAYCMMALHSIGLGGAIMDIIPPAINKKRELRELFGIPDGHEVVTSLIVGFPKYKYKRGIKRSPKSVSWV